MKPRADLKAALGPALFLLLSLFLHAGAQTGEDFVAGLQKSYEAGDFASYLKAFVPEARAKEELAIDNYFQQSGMKTVKLRQAGSFLLPGGETAVFIRALYQNSYSAIIENWQMTLDETEGSWRVLRKEVIGNIASLYRIHIPAERVERVEAVEIEHADITIRFKDAVVFYDNIPGLETALIILGRGRLTFSPSDPIEQHQLELLYKKKVLEGDLESLFVRCSSGFFQNRIKISRKEGGGGDPVGPEVRAAAGLLFGQDYPRSFTIENSLDGELLSFLPQGEEAVFELKGPKIGEMTYIYYPFSEEEVNLIDRTRDRILCLYSPRKAEAERNMMFVRFDERFDILDISLDIDYSPQQSFISGMAEITVEPQVDNLDSLKFRFNPDLEILRILDEEKRELFFTQDKLRDILYVYFLLPLENRKPARIEVAYRGRIVPPPPATDVLATGSLRDRTSIFSPRYETYLFTQSALWYPGPSDDDYFTSRLKVAIPKGYSCIANGNLIESGSSSGLQDVVVYETKTPVKYLAFIVGKMAKLSESAGSPPIQMFVAEEVLAQKKDLSSEARDILAAFTEYFGPFPYEKLTIVQRLWPRAGGHSPASFIVINETPRIIDQSGPSSLQSPVDLSEWEEYFLAHEIAHQWWGQAVTWATYRDQWLSEGMSQFAAVHYLRKKHGERAFTSMLKKFARWTEKKSNKGPILLGSRLSFFDFEAYQAIVYDKTTLVLNMLYDLVGEEVFFRGLKEFCAENLHRSAKTSTFFRTMEKAAGRSLQEFFRGWFSSYELPEVRAAWTKEGEGDQTVLRLKVNQVKGRFVFPLWVEWTSGGQTLRRMVVVDEAGEEFVLPTGAKPSRIRVNPDRAVPGTFD